ncbi:PEP-CTERM sorting domain-containing protein [Verrucomicrobiota bacterium sgz303538]
MKRAIRASALTAAAVISLARQATAANLTTTSVQASGDTNNWNSAIFGSPASSPTAGNTYEVLSGARVRSPNGTANSGGTGAANQGFTFVGDRLQLDGTGFTSTTGVAGASAELRFKASFDNITYNFPGVGSNAGLVLNGGILNDGDDRIITIAGKIEAVAGTTSSINPGGSATTDISAARGFLFTATLSGSGGLTLDYGHDITAATPALQLNTSSPSFSGLWTINAGWLKAVGTDSLGTGSVVVSGSQNASTLDLDYNWNNPAASLTLSGPNSKLRLDQDITLGAVIIDGMPLTAGTYTTTQLQTQFPSYIATGSNPSSTLTVVPEPANLAMAISGGIGMLMLRRRRA